MTSAGQPFTSQDVKDAYLGNLQPKDRDHTLIALVKLHEKECGPHLRPGTLKNYKATETYLVNFIQHISGKTDIHVSQLDYPFITQLENYILNNPIKSHDRCTANGTAKHIERVKKIVSWGKKMRWLKEDPFEEFTPHRVKTRREKMKLHQLAALEQMSLHSEHLCYVRDLFIFSCYTGFAYADVIKLKLEDFDISNQGKFWCNIYRTKSGIHSPVPLLPTAVRIMQQYKDHPKSVQNGTIFPPVTNQAVNRSLKVIGEFAKISVNLTFHLARHTFAYVVALKNGVPIEIVKVVMGHTKISTTEIYAGVDEEMIEEKMNGVEERLELKKREIIRAGEV